MFDYLPLGGIMAIYLPCPINLHYTQYAASLQGRIYNQAHG